MEKLIACCETFHFLPVTNCHLYVIQSTVLQKSVTLLSLVKLRCSTSFIHLFSFGISGEQMPGSINELHRVVNFFFEPQVFSEQMDRLSLSRFRKAQGWSRMAEYLLFACHGNLSIGNELHVFGL